MVNLLDPPLQVGDFLSVTSKPDLGFMRVQEIVHKAKDYYMLKLDNFANPKKLRMERVRSGNVVILRGKLAELIYG